MLDKPNGMWYNKGTKETKGDIQMSVVVKERNLIKFYVEKDKAPYVLDINTGVLYGRSGKDLQRTPNGMNRLIENTYLQSAVLTYMYRIHSGYGKPYSNFRNYVDGLKFYDKLDALNILSKEQLKWGLETSSNYINFINENFKEFVKYVRENENGNSTYVMEKFCREYQFVIWCKKHNVICDEYVTVDMIKPMANTQFTDEQIKVCLYYLRKGLYVVTNNRYVDYMVNYFRWCDKLGKPYAKGDFIREYATTKKEFEFRQKEFDNIDITRNQMARKNALEFSYGGLKVIIPTTVDEFINEADQQNNCVARMYMPRVIENTTNIVFVRKENELKKSYITCEVRDGHIIQYLAKNNSRVYDELGLEFKQLYQNHLDENWK